jgi:DNA-binding NarL/FixJ family response regulator
MKTKSQKAKPNCSRCKNRDTCTEQCDALRNELREKYPLNTNVGASPRFVIPSGKMKNELDVWQVIGDLASSETIGPTQREKAILTLDTAGFDRAIIAKMLGVKRSSIRKIVYAAKQKLANQ